MAKFRKTAALLACAIAASTATACSDTTYSLKAGDDEVKAGIYIGYLQNELSNSSICSIIRALPRIPSLTMWGMFRSATM